MDLMKADNRCLIPELEVVGCVGTASLLGQREEIHKYSLIYLTAVPQRFPEGSENYKSN